MCILCQRVGLGRLPLVWMVWIFAISKAISLQQKTKNNTGRVEYQPLLTGKRPYSVQEGAGQRAESGGAITYLSRALSTPQWRHGKEIGLWPSRSFSRTRAGLAEGQSSGLLATWLVTLPHPKVMYPQQALRTEGSLGMGAVSLPPIPLGL